MLLSGLFDVYIMAYESSARSIRGLTINYERARLERCPRGDRLTITRRYPYGALFGPQGRQSGQSRRRAASASIV
jgi:hypothetical protein